MDAAPPVVICDAPDGGWHMSDVIIGCTASDSGSGLASPSDAAFSLSTDVSAGVETPDASTNSRMVCDQAGNCTTGGPISGNKVDKKPPEVAVSTPAAGVYALNQVVASAYSCQDGGSGVASCVGPFPSGDAFTTASVGTHTFTVNAVDQVGNSTSRSIPYSVTYNICPLYDQTMAFASGDLVPIKLQLCDAGGVNVSAQTIVLTAIRLVQVSGSATAEVQAGGKGTPDNNFRYDASRTRYHFLLNSAGLATGTWRLEFTATGDGVTHAVQFQIR